MKKMSCEMFSNSINEFKSRPILYQRLIQNHLKDNPNCSCNIKDISFYKDDVKVILVCKPTIFKSKHPETENIVDTKILMINIYKDGVIKTVFEFQDIPLYNDFIFYDEMTNEEKSIVDNIIKDVE